MTRCGWPFRLSGSTAIAYCGLPFGHGGRWCCLTDSRGRVWASAPRYSAQGTKPVQRDAR